MNNSDSVVRSDEAHGFRLSCQRFKQIQLLCYEPFQQSLFFTRAGIGSQPKEIQGQANDLLLKIYPSQKILLA